MFLGTIVTVTIAYIIAAVIIWFGERREKRIHGKI